MNTGDSTVRPTRRQANGGRGVADYIGVTRSSDTQHSKEPSIGLTSMRRFDRRTGDLRGVLI